MKAAISVLRVWRAGEQDRAAAYALVKEYNQAVDVMVRDSEESFARDYFAASSGFWLAQQGRQYAGCIALRPLPQLEDAGEIKRLYVRPPFRGAGTAQALLLALEQYAAERGYWWLYLDSKDDLQAALRFYRRQGYQSCARYNSNPQATIFLRKSLRAPHGTDCTSG